MKLSKKDCENLIDALAEWQECVGCKEMDETDAGLDGDRYEDLMTRLGARHIQHSTDIREKKDWDIDDEERSSRASATWAGRISEALPAKTDEFIWVLDASSGIVFKVEIPANFPENGDYEDFLEANLPNDIRLKDCNWMIGEAGVVTIHRDRYVLGF